MSNAQSGRSLSTQWRGPCAVRDRGRLRSKPAAQVPVAILVGDEARIQAELDHFGLENLPIKIEHASKSSQWAITLGVPPDPNAAAQCTDASSSLGRRRLCDAFGRKLRCLPRRGPALGAPRRRCDRPAIATSLPTATKPTVLLDIGANVRFEQPTSCSSPDGSRLLQHSSRGGASNRRTSIEWQRGEQGHRYTSGGAPTAHPDAIELYRLCRGARSAGCADVVVTDGHTGNVVLKLCEGIVGVYSSVSEPRCGPIGSQTLPPSL